MKTAKVSSEQFAESYQNNLKRTISFLVSRGVPSDAAPDVAQSAWLRGWERLSQLRDGKMLLFWINQIALNHYRHSLRRAKYEDDWKPAYQNHSATHLDTAAIDVSTILDSCGQEHKRWLKAQMQGESPRELAKREGVTPTAIRIRMFRARKAAREWCNSASQPVPVAA